MVRQQWEKHLSELHVSQKKHDIPVIAFAGSVTQEAIACNQNGI